jgi:hypothetical protein
MDKRKELIGAIASIEMEDKFGADNFATCIASYFESHIDCPDEPIDDELGWKPWAMKKTDFVLNSIADEVDKELKKQWREGYREGISVNEKAIAEMESERKEFISECQRLIHEANFEKQKNESKDKQIAELENRLAELKLKVKKIDDLYDKLHNGIKYDEELNVYVLCWTEKEIADADSEAEVLYKAINELPEGE